MQIRDASAATRMPKKAFKWPFSLIYIFRNSYLDVACTYPLSDKVNIYQSIPLIAREEKTVPTLCFGFALVASGHSILLPLHILLKLKQFLI